ncbi:MAG: winged helix-turn-helix transcriptional regulator [Paludibacteraceae bacterium]|nr:winged helix-turn-helix transcriptional regulator [Paludibacteraceae bacterium]
MKEDFGIKDGIKDGIIKLNENQQIVLNIIRTNETLTAQVLAQKTGFGVRSVLRYLSELQSLGVIVRRGGRKSGYWEVIGK